MWGISIKFSKKMNIIYLEKKIDVLITKIFSKHLTDAIMIQLSKSIKENKNYLQIKLTMNW